MHTQKNQPQLPYFLAAHEIYLKKKKLIAFLVNHVENAENQALVRDDHGVLGELEIRINKTYQHWHEKQRKTSLLGPELQFSGKNDVFRRFSGTPRHIFQ